MFDTRKQIDAHPRWGKAAWRDDPFFGTLEIVRNDTSSRKFLQCQRDTVEEHIAYDSSYDTIGEAGEAEMLELDASKEGEYALKCQWNYNESEEGRNGVAIIKPVNFKDTK